MHFRLIGSIVLTLVIAGSLYAAQDGVMRSGGVTRTITDFAGPFRTNKLEANGVSLLSGPGVEFLLEIEHKGELLFLSPRDFEVKTFSTDKYTEELRTTFELMCKDKDIPVSVKLRYHRSENNCYIQKSLEVRSYKSMSGAMLRSIIMEDFIFRPDFAPVAPWVWSKGTVVGADARTRFDPKAMQGIVAYDAKSKSGLFFFMDSPFGKESFSVGGALQMREDVYVSLDKGYETGRATIGSAQGSPELAFKRLREYLWASSCALQSRVGNAGSAVKALDWATVKPLAADSATTDRRAEAYLRLCALRDLVDDIRKAAPESLVDLSGSADGMVADGHRLSVVDRIVPVAGAPLAWRQLRYELGFVLPAVALSLGSVDSVSTLPLAEAKVALVSLLSSVVVARPADSSPELLAFADKLAAFRKSHEPYFGVYQHVLSYPDGGSVDGEAHIVNNKGFIILYNPTTEPKRVDLPLAEPGLELRGEISLTDWSEFELPGALGSARVGDKVEVELAPSSYKIVGIDVAAPK